MPIWPSREGWLISVSIRYKGLGTAVWLVKMQPVIKFAIIATLIVALISLLWRNNLIEIPNWLSQYMAPLFPPKVAAGDQALSTKTKYPKELPTTVRENHLLKIHSTAWSDSKISIANINDDKYDISVVDSTYLIDTDGNVGIFANNIKGGVTETHTAYTRKDSEGRVGGSVMFVNRGNLFDKYELIRVHNAFSSLQDGIIMLWTLNGLKTRIAICQIDGNNMGYTATETLLLDLIRRLEELRKKYIKFRVIIVVRINANSNEMRALLGKIAEQKLYNGNVLSAPTAEANREDCLKEHIILDNHYRDFEYEKLDKGIESVGCSVNLNMD